MSITNTVKSVLLGCFTVAAVVLLTAVLLSSPTGADDEETRRLSLLVDEVEPDTYPFIVMGELTAKGQANWTAGLEAGTFLDPASFELDDDRQTINFSEDAGVEAEAVEAVILVREADTSRLIAIENRGTHLSYPVSNETLDIGLYIHEMAFEFVDFSPVCTALVQAGEDDPEEVTIGILANPATGADPVHIRYGETGPDACPDLAFEVSYGGHWTLEGGNS